MRMNIPDELVKDVKAFVKKRCDEKEKDYWRQEVYEMLAYARQHMYTDSDYQKEKRILECKYMDKYKQEYRELHKKG